jgi:endonuclease YncB( thermonuclease family)
VLVVGGPASAAPADNAVSVVDGDTIQIGSEIFPLHGIDAPELGQLCIDAQKWSRCGIAAAFELRKLLKFDEPLSCEPAPGDPRRYVCVAARADLALVLLKGGYVVAAPNSDAAYREAERQAREGNLGLWHMTFVPPWDWRAGKHLPGEREAEAAKCPIKAVLDANGRKVYYVPTDAVFKEIGVDIAAGERLFCSVAAAESAGWRRPVGR